MAGVVEPASRIAITFAVPAEIVALIPEDIGKDVDADPPHPIKRTVTRTKADARTDLPRLDPAMDAPEERQLPR